MRVIVGGKLNSSAENWNEANCINERSELGRGKFEKGMGIMLNKKIKEARVSFEYAESDNQDNLFTMGHVKYVCWFEVGGVKVQVDEYQCNPVYAEPNFADVFECLIGDARCIYGGVEFDWFCEELGYFPIESSAGYRNAKRAYQGCKRILRKLLEVFTNEELEIMMDMDEYKLHRMLETAA